MSCALEIKNLCKTYASGFEALKGISLKVHEGDFFALLGPNGAGKSTTIGIITSLVNSSSGEVYIYGVDAKKNPSEAKSQIGLVPQEFNFNQFEPAIEALINQAGYYGIAPKVAAVRAQKYLRQLGLWDKRNAEIRQLSGGLKRRFILARALVHEPRLLILDEPTAGVDIEVRRMIWQFMTDLNSRGTTIILTTHYLEEAENLCRNIAIIDHGKIIANTTMQGLLSRLENTCYLLYLNAALDSAPKLENIETHLLDSTTLEVTIPQKMSLNAIFAQLEEKGIGIISIKNKTNRLEEQFLKMITKAP